MQYHLRIWERYAKEGDGNGFIASPTITLADFAFWPILTPARHTAPGASGPRRITHNETRGAAYPSSCGALHR